MDISLLLYDIDIMTAYTTYYESYQRHHYTSWRITVDFFSVEESSL